MIEQALSIRIAGARSYLCWCSLWPECGGRNRSGCVEEKAQSTDESG